MKKVITVVLLSVLNLFTFAQTDIDVKQFAHKIDSMYSAYTEKIHAPGMVYGIVIGDRLVHSGNTGFADIGKKNVADSLTTFRIASMTKSFVGMAILRLRDEGKLDLDDPASNYIPELKDQQYLSTDAPPITIRHLLTHTAGFPEDNPWGDRQLDISEEEMLSMFRKGISFSSVPGTMFEYSNMGYAMLGQIVSKVSGMSYEQYVNKNILETLGMSHTYWEYADVPENRLAHGYRFVNGRWQEQPLLHAGSYGAMGGLITALTDFQKYVSFHLSAWPPSDRADNGPVRRSSVREMQQPSQVTQLNSVSRTGGSVCPSVIGYGYGLRWERDCRDRIFVGHSGGLPGFGSNWIIAPQYGVGVFSFFNVTYAPAGNINKQVINLILRASNAKPHKVAASSILEKRKDELVKVLPAWDTTNVGRIFAVNFFDDYFIDSLKKKSAAMFRQAGKIKKVHPVIPENNLRGTFVIECQNKNIEVFFTLTPENPPLVQELDYSIQAK